jgi:hypothetical protein
MIRLGRNKTVCGTRLTRIKTATRARKKGMTSLNPAGIALINNKGLYSPWPRAVRIA